MADGKEDAAMIGKPARDSVKLGCGTLIIIALIVMFFSGGHDTKRLRTQLDDMTRKIDAMNEWH